MMVTCPSSSTCQLHTIFSLPTAEPVNVYFEFPTYVVNSAQPDLLVCARLELVNPAAVTTGLGERVIEIAVNSEDNTAIGKEADI